MAVTKRMVLHYRDGWIWWPVPYRAWWVLEKLNSGVFSASILLLLLWCLVYVTSVLVERSLRKDWICCCGSVWELVMSISDCKSNMNVNSCSFVLEREFYWWMQFLESCSNIILCLRCIVIFKKKQYRKGELS